MDCSVALSGMNRALGMNLVVGRVKEAMGALVGWGFRVGIPLHKCPE